jgi:hypothetical protein
MKQAGIVVLISVAASAAAPAPRAAHKAVTLETSKTVEQFGGCFVNAQDRAAMAWSYIPQSRGGTFSNLGAKGVRASYFLAVLDRGSTREIRLETASAGASIDSRVSGAVDQCI